MIAFVRGKVFAFGLGWVIIDTGHIGYKINFNQIDKLKKNEEVTIYTYQNVREDDISLFGFLSLNEYDLFIKLISVKGVGCKTALNILSKTSVKDLVEAIENEDIKFIKSLPSIGAKTASQMILDLQGKLVSGEDSIDSNENNELSDAKEALKSLGYKQAEINKISKSLSKEKNLTSDEYLKLGLKLLMKGK